MSNNLRKSCITNYPDMISEVRSYFCNGDLRKPPKIFRQSRLGTERGTEQGTGQRPIPQNTKHKTQNTKHKIQNTKHKIQNTKHKTQNTKHKIQNTKHKTQNTKHKNAGV
ncbi:MAG: hypothetical protein F6K17_02410 [Okeania sp. SIO3C4]|nr:hypothetical protein [Okeania sp. SIO3C4]